MLIVFKDGLNAKYQKSIAKKGVLEKSYDEYKIAFFLSSRHGPEFQAIQVDLDSSFFNSSYCCILQTRAYEFLITPYEKFEKR